VLTNTRGLPWTQDSFRASWNGTLEAPNQKYGVLPQPHPLWPIKRAGLVFHGLRKSAVVMLLEVGCTTAEVQAITGQSMQMVEHYAKQVNQKKLAAAAILKWENGA
jgi:integrase